MGHFDPGWVDEELMKKYERAQKRLDKLWSRIRDQTEANPA